LNPLVQSFIKKFPCHLTIEVGHSFEWMQRVWAGVVASGTASLEAGCVKMPYVLVYKVNALTYWIAKMVVKIKFIGIVNIIANEKVVTELVQGKCEPIQLKNELSHLILDEHHRGVMLEKLDSLVSQLQAADAASVSAAKAIVKKIKDIG
jgi:lipid-A-disaccharide synthase